MEINYLQVKLQQNACGIATATVKKIATRDGGNELRKKKEKKKEKSKKEKKSIMTRVS